MSNRCEECQKFVSLQTEEPEDYGLDISGLSLTGEISMARSCMDCGGEMKEYIFDVEIELSDFWPEGWPDISEGREISLGDYSLSEVEEVKRQFSREILLVGYELEATVSVEDLGDFQVMYRDTVQASEFEELY